MSSGKHKVKKTHCKFGHEYTTDNTYVRPGTTWRKCRICINASDKLRREKKRELK